METNIEQKFEEGLDEELRLAEEIKKNCCDESGKEIYSARAAELLHKIGLVYRRRSPNKIALIKSVGLFNAAIVRKPSNLTQVKSDLVQTCQHVLQEAKAVNQNANLIEKANQVKALINQLRCKIDGLVSKLVPKIFVNSTREEFQKLVSNKVLAIQQINETTTVKYKQIMADLSQFCEDVMGSPPCEYAIAGMGSLARSEITPYSDFEHIMLLFDDKNSNAHVEYFKWFSVIFHVIVLNIQETIIPSLNVKSLNDDNSKSKDWFYDAITPRGISFDGMMPHACKFPLGRQDPTKNKQFSTELIKPVSEMLKYLTFEADLKNGYHLADILTKTCFVFGSNSVYKQFENGAKRYQNGKSYSDIVNDVKEQVKNDLNNYSTRHLLANLKSQNALNIKQLVYRSTTLFVTALARIHNVSANSCFDITDVMAANNAITPNTAKKLKCAIAIACEMRLRVYIEKKSQCDSITNLQHDGTEKFLDIVGALCTANYFQIVYCLQCEVAKQLKFTKLHFYSDPQLLNIMIALALGIRGLTDFSQNLKKRTWDLSTFNFDECISQLEVKWNFSISETLSHSHTLMPEQIKVIANFLYGADVFDEALDFYKQLLDVYQNKSKSVTCDNDIAWTNHLIGRCLNELNRNVKALDYLNRALEIRERITLNGERDGDIAATLNGLGWCHIDLLNYDAALPLLNRTLAIYENITVNAEKDRNISRTLHNLGNCYADLQNYERALEYLNRAFKIEQSVTSDADRDRGLGITRINIGRCHVGLQKYDDSLIWFNQALTIFQNTTSDEGIDRRMSDTFNYIGECLIEKQHFLEAQKYLERAQNIYQTITKDATKDPRLARTLHNIGIVLFELKKFRNARKYLDQSLKIYERLPSSNHLTAKIEIIRSKIQLCLSEDGF